NLGAPNPDEYKCDETPSRIRIYQIRGSANGGEFVTVLDD
ncbi:MAG: hypothetical protein ACI97A_000440, partial [Planctomycetota bacterium]